jgi:hypothetical protein
LVVDGRGRLQAYGFHDPIRLRIDLSASNLCRQFSSPGIRIERR